VISALLQVAVQLWKILPDILPWLGIAAAIALLWAFGGQLRHPSGWFGRTWMESILNSGNRRLLDAAVRLLAPRSGERIADIGFGGGYAIDQILPLVKPACPVGIDVSEMMIDIANEKWDDQVELYLAAVTSMPLTEHSLDAVLTVHTIYFWSDPVGALKEIHRVLKPGGRLVLGVGNVLLMRLSPLTWFRFRLYSQEKLEALLVEAGFGVRFEMAGGGLLARATTPLAPK